MAVVGVLAAAGYATRLQPLDCSKEVLPVAGKPIIQYIVDRMQVAECDEIRIVTREEKTDVIEYGEAIAARVILARPPTVTQSYAAGIQTLAPDDIVLIGWPDTLWEPRDGYVRLLHALRDGADAALGLFRLEHDLERSDVVVRDDQGRVRRIEIKPAAPPSPWIWGCAAAPARLFDELGLYEWPGEFFSALCGRGADVAGVELSDRWLDIGTYDALARAPDWLARG
jgi:glucose-1-phosphate thymidylyltransferase